jgi:hypothetical protein
MRELLKVYLAIAGPGPRAEAARRSIAASECAAAVAAWSGQLAIGRARRGELLARLGPPDHVRGNAAGYLLDDWPSYAYELHFDPRGVLTEIGFERLGPAANLRALQTRPDWPHGLAEVGATRSEVRAMLGVPVEESGWWPVDDWRYPDGLLVELRHGIVETVARLLG